MLPSIKIIFENGLIGASSPMADGVTGVIATASAVDDKFETGKAYLITAVEGLTNLGLTATNAATLVRFVKEFYMEAPTGSNLWLMGVPSSVSLETMIDKQSEYAVRLIEAAKGEIRLLVALDGTTENPQIEAGLNAKVYAAIPKAQALGEWAANEKFAPIFTLLEGMNYTGIAADLDDIRKMEANRVGVFIGHTEPSGKGSCIGLLAGRIAGIPVQRSVMRVRSGAIRASKLFLANVPAENGKAEIISDKGFITVRNFVGKTGYFFTDDTLATAVNDDYALIPRRRVMDKAARVAYAALLDELGEEIPITSDGRIPAPTAKNIQNSVERALINNLTVYGNLGNDPTDQNDTGVECYIDTDQNVVATSRMEIVLRVKPYGYPKYIDCYLGFQTNK